MATEATHKKDLMIDALQKSLGVVTTAAKNIGIDRCTHYKWYHKDKKYRKKVDDIDNIALDFAESQLHKQISKGEVSATIFYLKCKGKKRGYIERQEITGADGRDLGQVVIFKIPDNGRTLDNSTPKGLSREGS